MDIKPEPVYVTVGEMEVVKLKTMSSGNVGKESLRTESAAPTQLQTPGTSNSSSTDDSDESGKDSNLPGRPKPVGFDRYFLYFLFYVSVIQSFIKTIICITIISLDVHWANLCGLECKIPVYTHQRAVYFITTLVLCGLSTAHFCVGVWIFTKYQSLTKERLQYPMLFCAIILCAEVCVMILVAVVTNVKMEILVGCAVIITTELICVLTAFCYPTSYYSAISADAAALRNVRRNEEHA